MWGVFLFLFWGLTDEEEEGAGVVELVLVVDSGGCCGDGGVRRAGLLRGSYMLALLVYTGEKKSNHSRTRFRSMQREGDLQRRGDWTDGIKPLE